MKKTLLLLCTVSTSFFFFGQTSINLDVTNIPSIGFSFVNVNTVNTSGIDLGLPGENLTYDFTAFSENTLDSVDYVDPNSTLNGSLFLNSNLAVTAMLDSSYTYFNSNSTQLDVVGMITKIPLIPNKVVLTSTTNPLRQLDFPATYLSGFSDSSNLKSNAVYFPIPIPAGTIPVVDTAYIDSAKADITIHRVSLIDAWGNLLDRYGNNFSVLRQVVTDIRIVKPVFRVTTETANPLYPAFGPEFYVQNLGYITIPGFDYADTTKTVFFLTNEVQPYIIAEFGYTQDVLTSAKYAQFPYAVGINENENSQSQIYPNPSNSVFNVVSKSKINSLKVISADGKIIVLDEKLNHSAKIDLTKFESGIYTLILETEKGQEIKKINKL
ncbi:MAG: T9SS type A sorting domain-containing protein [Bacteroidota bacterium]